MVQISKCLLTKETKWGFKRNVLETTLNLLSVKKTSGIVLIYKIRFSFFHCYRLTTKPVGET